MVRLILTEPFVRLHMPGRPQSGTSIFSWNPADTVHVVPDPLCCAGMGLTCLEELKWGDKAHPWIKPGTLFTRGPGEAAAPHQHAWSACKMHLAKSLRASHGPVVGCIPWG